MKRKITIISIIFSLAFALLSFNSINDKTPYEAEYFNKLNDLKTEQSDLLQLIQQSELTPDGIAHIKGRIQLCRNKMKGIDFWLRYLEPVSYKSINGPLPVEWETEVFEKFEKPYRRDGAGLTLASLYLDESDINKDTLLHLIQTSLNVMDVYKADTVVSHLKTPDHFFLCNRLYLLNLAAIYTTGFECPDPAQVVPELRLMMHEVKNIYSIYNLSFPDKALPDEYLALYEKALTFVDAQNNDMNKFNHYDFIREFVNPLFTLNQQYIQQYHVFSKSMVDYSLNKNVTSIFSKSLYNGQNAKGIFLRVKDSATLAEIDRVGHLLFFDPILSGNNRRSCASCHKPEQYFADTLGSSNLQFNNTEALPRNTPSLVNAGYNHLLMLDGKHTSLQNQVHDVITNKVEMGSDENEVLQKVLSCKEYKKVFTALLKLTPQEKEITIEHIASAITYYYSKFSQTQSPFDNAMNNKSSLSASETEGFNLFMSKAQCGTCHFVPMFNGVKPPYVGSEFEVLGVPADTNFKKLSPDNGRYVVFQADETKNAFRTGTIRNAAMTAPYMHNGVFKNLNQVIDFYNNGGGAGKGLNVPNQTLSSDSLKLTVMEKTKLIAFIKTLNEPLRPELPPKSLPKSSNPLLNNRKVGGIY
ncbi:cytochrome C peroxidase [Taibaiella lutea]|uniref:Cytochrome C peroxidase n=1 Tax=Taibaiella lutea TaxID=2608001 RepID=A0A5M6CHP6_9BACT|nr:cytochrome c peroxidase [Taibaiella lutea]KAA5534721.1 cytochrome C peroxidase [Taibaiella lutea]